MDVAQRLPRVVVHADWSTDARKRWMLTATLEKDGYRLGTPEPVGETRTLIQRKMNQAAGGGAVFGFDFPIGLPDGYAFRAGIENFPALLPMLGTGRWSRFLDLAVLPGEISIDRPFYPYRPGGTKQSHLVDGLGVGSMKDLLRQCELAYGTRGQACSLFWILGGNQVGRAAISGWRDVIIPGLARLSDDMAIWPFDGELHSLLKTRPCVIAETYPAEACVNLGLPAPGRSWSKRKQPDRMRWSEPLTRWASLRAITFDKQLELSVAEGFGSEDDGEDQFDAFVGLLSMLEVIEGKRAEGAPQDNRTLTVEGWILGQRTPLVA